MAEPIDKETSIKKLEEICNTYTKNNPKNPTALIDAIDQKGNGDKAIIATYISYAMMNKILYVINRSSVEWQIRAEANNVLVIIRYFR